VWSVLPDGTNGELVSDAELTFVMLNLDTRKAEDRPAAFIALLGVEPGA
jgi:hypothetical protein